MRTLALLMLLLCSGCLPMSAPFHLHPVVDGGADPSPIPCRAKLHFGWQTHSFVATLPSGEVCRGQCKAPIGHVTSPDRDMAPLWDKVYGPHFFNAHVMGSRGHQRVVLKGERGSTVRLEFHQVPGQEEGRVQGVAIDQAQRLYKIGL